MKAGERVRFKKSFPLNHIEERAGKTGVVTAISHDTPGNGNPILQIRLDDGRVAARVVPALVEIINGP